MVFLPAGVPTEFQICSVASIPVYVHLLLLLYLAYELSQAVASVPQSQGALPDYGKVGVALLFGTLSFVILFFTVFIHELGHCAGAKVVGGRAHRILLWPLGGLAFISGGGGSAGDLVIALAGPATHLPMYFAWNELHAAAAARGAADVIVQVCASGARLQIMLAAFNLLVPAYPLDCSQALVALLRLCGVPAKASAWFIIVCSLACLALIVCCMVQLVHLPMLPSGYNSMSILMVMWLGFQTYRLWSDVSEDNVKGNPLFAPRDGEDSPEEEGLIRSHRRSGYGCAFCAPWTPS